MKALHCPKIEIGKRVIGPGRPPYVVAEMSANHQQDFGLAAEILHAAKQSGADAVKLQTYTADSLTIDSDRPWFRLNETVWAGQTLYQLYTDAATPWPWQPELKRIADSLEMDLFSTPFDAAAVRFLEEMGVPAFKIASFELVDVGLLRRVARTGKPIILSTGMATLGEIDEAVRAIRREGGKQLALLHCTSAYPADPRSMHLRTVAHLAQAFDVPVGLSDHSLEIAVPVAAVALGACIIEKHLTLRRADGGPDSGFSLEPDEFADMVRAVRAAHAALGQVPYGPTDDEQSGRRLRRSLFVVRDVRAGELFAGDNVRSIRPAAGLHPRHLGEVLGHRATENISRGTPLEWKHIC